MLPVGLPPIASEITLGDQKFVVKDEFHVTLLWLPAVQELVVKDKKSEEELLKTVVKIFHRTDVSFDQFLDDIRLAQHKNAKTIVIMCRLKGIDQFFVELRKALKIDVPTQTTHVTLYTLENGIPIGINNKEQLAGRTRKLTDRDLEIVKKAIGFNRLKSSS